MGLDDYALGSLKEKASCGGKISVALHLLGLQTRLHDHKRSSISHDTIVR